MAPKYSVLIVSSNPHFCAVMPALLARRPALSCEGHVDSLDAAVTMSSRDPADVILSDAPPADLRQVLAWRKIRENGSRLAMLTRYVDQRTHLLSVLAGASALILVPERRLLETICDVARGDVLRTPEVAGYLRALVSGEAPGPLTANERRVVGLIADGLRDDEIAEELQISSRAVQDHIMSLVEKLA